MQIAHRANALNQIGIRSFDGWIAFAYIAFATVVMIAAYAASGEAGVSAGELLVMTALP